jgi:hypothetical protein
LNSLLLRHKIVPPPSLNQARAPVDRLRATNTITQERREQLQALRKQTNPRQLRQEIYEMIDHIFALPGADPEITEDVYQTLAMPVSTQKGELDTLVTLSFDRTIALQ